MNARKHTIKDLATNKRIIELIQQYNLAKNDPISNKKFKYEEVKYLCVIIIIIIYILMQNTPKRILILGRKGSGCSTLGNAILKMALGYSHQPRHFSVDDIDEEEPEHIIENV